MESKVVKIVTGRVRFSYANVWEPRSINGEAEKYSVCLIISKDDRETLDKINLAVEEAKRDGISKFGGRIPEDLKLPLRDGDIERPDDEAYENSYFINASSTFKPAIVDKDLKPIANTSEFYSGCYGRASIVFYAFNSSGSRGIACGLRNLQKYSDGERLMSRNSVEEDFGAFEDDILS